MLALLILPFAILGFSAAAVMLPKALESLANAGPHGLSEILYAYSSAAGNNGSAFAGLNANTPWFNTTLGIAMLFGRFAYVIPVLAMAGSIAAKRKAAASSGTFPTRRRAVHRPARRRDFDPGRTAIFSSPRAWPDRRALSDARRQDVLRRRRHVQTRLTYPLFDPAVLRQAAIDAVTKLHPRKLVRNPVMFVTGVVAASSLHIFLRDLADRSNRACCSPARSRLWLWFTVLFANFAEAVAEGRGKAQADALRRTRVDTRAKVMLHPDDLTDDLWEPNLRSICKEGESFSSRPATRSLPTVKSSKA